MSFKDLMTYKRIRIRHVYTSVISWCWLIACSSLIDSCHDFSEIRMLLLASALPFRRLCIFKVGRLYLLRVVVHLILTVRVQAEVRARQWGWCTWLDMHLLLHFHSHIAVWGDASILCTCPCKCHRILDLQLLLPNGRNTSPCPCNVFLLVKM